MNKNKLFPPGTNVAVECCVLGTTIGWMVIAGMSFISKFQQARENLYDDFGNGVMIRNLDREMPKLRSLVSGRLYGLLIVLLGCAAIAVGHYVSYYRESKSIYVMKRVSSRAEIHVRCLAVPLITFAVALIIAFIMFRLYVWGYYYFSPEGSLPKQVDPSFWRAVL
ncbi:MAG: hypothetical protein IKX54_04920 [Lachnospiraceae bacterium]|nr:hypothetical protein [Lachnospiraceae bacterium]